MRSLTIYNRSGDEIGRYDLDPAEIAERINKQLLHDVVVMYQASRRQGSARTRSRAEVVGSTRKLYRQKGTGNARAGARRSGIRRGGGHIFARRQRDYSYRLPKKAIRAATRMAIASKIIDDQVVVIDELVFDAPATKDMAAILRALGLYGTSTLIVTADHDANVYKSGRNIVKISISPVSGLNALSVLTPRRLLVTRAAMDAIRHREGAVTQVAGDDSGG